MPLCRCLCRFQHLFHSNILLQAHQFATHQTPPHLSSHKQRLLKLHQLLVNESAPQIANEHLMRTKLQNNIKCPKMQNDYTITYPVCALTVVSTTTKNEPKLVSTAVKNPSWCQAMNDEFIALMSNKTWKLVPIQPKMNIIGYKWIYHLKRKADGCTERHKTRLVAKSLDQQLDLNYIETYSPMVKP